MTDVMYEIQDGYSDPKMFMKKHKYKEIVKMVVTKIIQNVLLQDHELV